MSEDRICTSCFYSHRTDVHFRGCPHENKEELYVIWNKKKQVCETTEKTIRPLPTEFPTHWQYFTMCEPPKCSGFECNRAHGKAELDAWNETLSK